MAKSVPSFFLFKSFGIAIHRVNAICVMGTTGSMGKLEELNYLQGRNHGENLGSTSAMVGRICPLLVGIGLRYLKI